MQNECKWYKQVRSTLSSYSLHGMVDAKWRPNNERGGWSRVSTIVVSEIWENNNATMGCMMQEKNA
jgi:hypothetical protein